MKQNLLFALILILIFSVGLEAKELSFILMNTNDTCQFGPKIWLLDNNDDYNFEYLVYGGCPQKARAFALHDKSNTPPNADLNAVLRRGSLMNNNFLIYLVNPVNFYPTHRIYYDNILNAAILEDYIESGGGSAYIDETDNYFTTQISGGYIRMFKKTELNVKAMSLCSLEGIVLDNKPVYENQSEFYFDLTFQPAGMYFIRIISDTKVFVKKVIYTK
jgi:hypothetical protein